MVENRESVCMSGQPSVPSNTHGTLVVEIEKMYAIDGTLATQLWAVPARFLNIPSFESATQQFINIDGFMSQTSFVFVQHHSDEYLTKRFVTIV